MSNCVLICLGWLSSLRDLLFSDQKIEEEWIWGRRDVWGTQLGENKGRNSVVVIYFMREESIFLIKLKYFLIQKITEKKEGTETGLLIQVLMRKSSLFLVGWRNV